FADGYRPAGEAGARPSGHDRATVGPADLDGGGHLFGADGQADDSGVAFEHRGVAAVEGHLRRRRLDPGGRHDGLQISDETTEGTVAKGILNRSDDSGLDSHGLSLPRSWRRARRGFGRHREGEEIRIDVGPDAGAGPVAGVTIADRKST